MSMSEQFIDYLPITIPAMVLGVIVLVTRLIIGKPLSKEVK